MALRPLFAAALVVCSRYLIMVPRPLPAAPLVVRRRYLAVVPRPLHAAKSKHLRFTAALRQREVLWPCQGIFPGAEHKAPCAPKGRF